MSDDEDSEDERMKALMATWEREGEDDEKGKSGKKSKKKKKKKGKDKEAPEEEEEADGGELVEKKKKKKKSKDKEKDKDKEKEKSKSKEKKEKSKKSDDGEEKPKKKEKSKKKKDKDKDKDKEKDKDKSKSKSKSKSKKDKSKKKKSEEDEPEIPAAPIKVEQTQVDYVDEDDAASENSEDQRMKELLQQWGDDESSDDSDSSDDEEDDDESVANERRMTKDELGLKDNALDHIVLAAPDFDEAMKEFETMTGIKPSIGGSLKGLGIKTARVGLDNQVYIEIMAPDPVKSGPLGAQLMNLEEGALVPYHFAIRQTNLEEMSEDYVPNELGYAPDRIVMTLAGTDGLPRKWEMLFMHGHFQGGTVPFFVDWGECEHPIGTIAQGGSLKDFVVSCPGGSQLQKLLAGVKDISVEDGDPKLEFSFGSPEGTITFSAENPHGIKFPGYQGPGSDHPPAPNADDDDDDDDEDDDDDDDEDDDEDEDDDDDDEDDDEDDDDDDED